MKEAIIACEMLRDELLFVMEKLQCSTPVIWLEKGLHDTPERLNKELLHTIEELEAQGYTRLLLTFSYCGGALNGLSAQHAELVAPRFDDCIRMLLSLQEGERNAADPRSLYFTPQWLTSDRYILRDFEDYQRRYGEKKAAKVMKAMLANYRHYCMIDTGTYDLSPLRAQGEADAETLRLSYSEQNGSVRVLEKLLLHQFDSEFCVLPPGQSFRTEQFLMV